MKIQTLSKDSRCVSCSRFLPCASLVAIRKDLEAKNAEEWGKKLIQCMRCMLLEINEPVDEEPITADDLKKTGIVSKENADIASRDDGPQWWKQHPELNWFPGLETEEWKLHRQMVSKGAKRTKLSVSDLLHSGSSKCFYLKYASDVYFAGIALEFPKAIAEGRFLYIDSIKVGCIEHLYNGPMAITSMRMLFDLTIARPEDAIVICVRNATSCPYQFDMNLDGYMLVDSAR